MRLFNILPLVLALVPAAFSVGCAQSDEDSSTGDDNLTASAGGDFTASVGAVAINGKRVCTAALVDVDAEARIGSVSASGRQVVLGGACIGALRGGIGGAVFVTEHNGFSLATPIVSVDFESQASAGLAVGILSGVPQDTRPMRLLGADATVSGGAHAATILRADDNGLLVGAAVEIHAGVGFNIVTPCTDWHFHASAGIAVGAAVAAGEQGFGAAAIVKVNGELRFAAHIDGQCIAHEVADGVHHIASGALEGANDVGDAVSQLGAGQAAGYYAMKQQVTTVKFRFYQDARELRINGQGRISASTAGASCGDGPLGPVWLGACDLKPANGFRKGQTIDVTVDTHGNIWPDHQDGTHVFFSLGN